MELFADIDWSSLLRLEFTTNLSSMSLRFRTLSLTLLKLIRLSKARKLTSGF